ncbi:CCHC-type domain-containing protein [Caerostris darwini]|uniref:CCHC-type domain-containing protein n=1 Tax=Caerostris darwini TaxID=1538125 RepID=A0AAV4QDY5_9ARAC|nr:CCHC-type domain-containing protein [Caerostris darwini]
MYALKTHCLVHTGEEPYECQVCKRKFTLQSRLKRHSIVHSDKKPFVCTLCNKGFARSDSLKEHYLSHTGEKIHECSHCQKKFTHSSHLKRHIAIHDGLKPYECDTCGKCFSQFGHLKNHHKTHSENSFDTEKLHKCDVCEKMFKRKSSLKRHLEIHTNVKPFECEFCDKSYSRSCSLKIHYLTHTKELPHACDLCDKKYASKSTLRFHYLMHAQEKSHTCSVCQKGFTTRSVMKRHELIHKSEKYSCTIGQLSGWSHSQMLIIAKLKLEGNARKVYEASLQNDKELTYEKFKEAMTSHFKETPPFATEFAKFSSAVQFEFENGKDFSIRVQDPSSFAEVVDFALRVESSFEVASPNVNVISQTDSNAVEGVKEGFTKTLDLVLKQLEHLNTRIDELDKQKDIPENNYTNQPPSQRRDRKPLKCFYCGRLGHIAPECQRKRRDYQQRGLQTILIS